MEITNFTIEYWTNIKKINLFENSSRKNLYHFSEGETINKLWDDSNSSQRNSFFMKTTNSLKKTSFWCSISQQKRDNTISKS